MMTVQLIRMVLNMMTVHLIRMVLIHDDSAVNHIVDSTLVSGLNVWRVLVRSVIEHFRSSLKAGRHGCQNGIFYLI